jgi:pyruvate dehydrogenase E1 component
MVPEAVEAAKRLEEEGVLANVIAVPGPGPLYRRFQESVRGVMHPSKSSEQVAGPRTAPFLADVVPQAERKAPVVTVLDGHPHMLAWLGGALSTRVFPLGVTRFGQSGSQPDLYREYGIDVSSIMAACFGALES